jgi:hypothetical protein
MRSRLARLGGTTAAVVALLGPAAPPAQATTAAVVSFVGTVTLSGPLGYPCVGPGAPAGTVDSGLCPQAKTNIDNNPNPHFLFTGDMNTTLLHMVGWAALTQSRLTLPGAVPTPNPAHWPDFHHNRRAIVALSSLAGGCVNQGTNVNKPGKAPTHAGACSFTLTAGSLPNTMAGNCGLASGQAIVTFTDALGQAYTLDLHIAVISSLLYIGGHSKKVGSPQVGLFELVGNVIPPIPTVTAGSCTNKTATTFTLAGTAAMGG